MLVLEESGPMALRTMSEYYYYHSYTVTNIFFREGMMGLWLRDGDQGENPPDVVETMLAHVLDQNRKLHLPHYCEIPSWIELMAP